MTVASEGTKIPQSSSPDIKEEKSDSVEVAEVSEGTKTPQATDEDEVRELKIEISVLDSSCYSWEQPVQFP